MLIKWLRSRRTAASDRDAVSASTDVCARVTSAEQVRAQNMATIREAIEQGNQLVLAIEDAAGALVRELIDVELIENGVAALHEVDIPGFDQSAEQPPRQLRSWGDVQVQVTLDRQHRTVGCELSINSQRPLMTTELFADHTLEVLAANSDVLKALVGQLSDELAALRAADLTELGRQTRRRQTVKVTPQQVLTRRLAQARELDALAPYVKQVEAERAQTARTASQLLDALAA